MWGKVANTGKAYPHRIPLSRWKGLSEKRRSELGRTAPTTPGGQRAGQQSASVTTPTSPCSRWTVWKRCPPYRAQREALHALKRTGGRLLACLGESGGSYVVCDSETCD